MKLDLYIFQISLNKCDVILIYYFSFNQLFFSRVNDVEIIIDRVFEI